LASRVTWTERVSRAEVQRLTDMSFSVSGAANKVFGHSYVSMGYN